MGNFLCMSLKVLEYSYLRGVGVVLYQIEIKYCSTNTLDFRYPPGKAKDAIMIMNNEK